MLEHISIPYKGKPDDIKYILETTEHTKPSIETEERYFIYINDEDFEDHYLYTSNYEEVLEFMVYYGQVFPYKLEIFTSIPEVKGCRWSNFALSA